MSYPRDLDEIPEAELLAELSLRRQRQEAGRCDYCGRKAGSLRCQQRKRHEAAGEVEEQPKGDAIGCGDSGCVFGTGEGTRYGGQHTNGGCRCLIDLPPRDRLRLRRWIVKLRKERDELRQQVASLKPCPDCKEDDAWGVVLCQKHRKEGP